MENSNQILQFCRLCLVKDSVNVPIFEEQGDIRQIYLKISSCLPVKVSRDDELPKKICDGCSYKLDMVYDFRNTSVNAEKQLTEWLGEAHLNSESPNKNKQPETTQRVKTPETFVKQEAIDPSDVQKEEEEEEDDKNYMFQPNFEESSAAAAPAGLSATATSNEEEEEPPPKRAKRTAAVKASIAMDQSDEEDDDDWEPITKREDDSEGDSDGEDNDAPFVDVPSTSADDQPGPSGVGKDGVEAPTFKIVDTLGDGKLKQLRIVPEAWEKNGVLFWPNTEADTLVTQGNSVPEEDWFQIPCILKKSKLTSLKVARKKINIMSQSEIDELDTIVPNVKQAKSRMLERNQVTEAKQSNGKTLTQHCSEKCPRDSKTALQQHVRLWNPSQNKTIFQKPNNQDTMKKRTDSLTSLFPISSQDFSQLPFFSGQDETCDKILKNQEIIIENQNVIINRLGGFDLMFQKLMKMVGKTENCEPEHIVYRNVDPILEEFKPIDSIEEMNLLEEKLKSEELMERFIEKLSLICGSTGKEYGLNVCYALVDNLFTRKYMTLCSWAGGSRGEKEKIPFKVYRNIISLFFKLVHLADNNFTLENCENFLKTVLKNSTRRNETKTYRSSRSKKRPKNLLYRRRGMEKRDDNNEAIIRTHEYEGNVEMMENEYDLGDNEEYYDSDESYTEVLTVPEVANCTLNRPLRRSSTLTHLLAPTINPDDGLMCYVCLISYESSEELKNHSHILPSILYCTHCKGYFPVSHQCPTTKLLCAFCKQKFDMQPLNDHKCFHIYTRNDLEKIMSSENKVKTTRSNGKNKKLNSLGMRICKACNVEFKTSKDYEKHYYRVHRIHNCKLCNVKFGTPAEYRKHRYEKHEQGRHQICPYCGKAIVHLTQHVKAVHGNKDEVKCPKCDKTFSCNKHLYRHRLVHTNDYKHKCSACGKGFKTPFSLRVHKRSHDEVKPFECAICKKTFTTKQWRDNHQRTHR